MISIMKSFLFVQANVIEVLMCVCVQHFCIVNKALSSAELVFNNYIYIYIYICIFFFCTHSCLYIGCLDE